MSRSYYALVAGFPDILIEDKRLPFIRKQFKEDLKEYLDEADYDLIKLFLYKYDNENLINLLLKKEAPFNELGNFNKEELEDEIKTPIMMPSYMKDFVEMFKNSTPMINNLSWENQLTFLYYQYAMSYENSFIKEWFEFELNLNNILIALNCRKIEMDLDKELIGENYVVDHIKKSNSGDFGLSRDLPYVEKILQLYSAETIIEREKSLDLLRIDYIDELTTFNYFTIEKIAGFFIKLGIVERWITLDEETGNKMFKDLLDSLESGFSFPVEFSLSGGKK